MQTLDCRGLACPAPVLRTKEAIENGSVVVLSVRVDNEASGANVSRFLSSRGYRVEMRREDGDISVTGTLKGEPAVMDAPEEAPSSSRILVMITTDRIGFGDDQLGLGLMKNFLLTLKEMGEELWKLVFINNGVKLTIDGAKALPSILELESSGVGVMVCGTCLDHFGLLEKKRVGETTNMLDIVIGLQAADKVINL